MITDWCDHQPTSSCCHVKLLRAWSWVTTVSQYCQIYRVGEVLSALLQTVRTLVQLPTRRCMPPRLASSWQTATRG